MALTINIYYHGKNGNAILFAQEMVDSGLVEEIRNREGNLKYEYYLSLNDEETVLLVDQWVNQEALNRHHQSKVMEKIMALRNKYNLTMEVHRYPSEEAIPLSDESYLKK